VILFGLLFCAAQALGTLDLFGFRIPEGDAGLPRPLF
jgi:hypothetical protein